MDESTGRRIKKSLLIKTTSIRFLVTDEISDLKKIDRISSFIVKREKEIKIANSAEKIDKSLLINGRNFTNLGLFREYAQMYLQTHEQINQKMTIMCRQLAPTAQGIPLEIYAFSKDKIWVNYEHISSDIFDHLLAAIPYFHLECFELSPILPKP
jgi:miniconductance mechanosensitive channel